MKWWWWICGVFFFCSGPPEKKNWEKVRRFLAGPIDKIHHLHNMLGILQTTTRQYILHGY